MPEAAEAAAAIDGEDGVHWHLPLPPLTKDTLFEPYSTGGLPCAWSTTTRDNAVAAGMLLTPSIERKGGGGRTA